MRRYGIESPYEKLKDLTRGQAITQKSYTPLSKALIFPTAEKDRLLALTPGVYIGNAADQARRI